MLIRKYVKITIKENKSILDDNFYFYQNDRNVDIFFGLVNFKFDFIKNQISEENVIQKTNATFSSLRIIKPNGEKLIVTRCPIENNYIKFSVTPDFIDELDEIGIHQLQITLYDEFEGRISIPPINFEVLEPLFDDFGYYEEGQADLDNIDIIHCSNTNDINGRPEITPGTNLYEWQHGDWISASRLNAIQDNILELNNMTANDVKYDGIEGVETVRDALDTLLNAQEETIVPIISDKVTTYHDNQEIILDGSILTQVTIFNKTENEINVIINQGEIIPLDIEESLSLGNIKIFSIIIVEMGSTIKYIGY